MTQTEVRSPQAREATAGSSESASCSWLTEAQQSDWLAYVVATRRFWSQVERDLQNDAGLSLTHYEILSMLSEADGSRMRMSALGKILQVSLSRLSQAVSKLEEQGLVKRELSPNDRRSWFALLTPTGLEVLERAAPRHVASVRRHLIDLLSPAELRQLGDISRHMLDHLAPGLDLTRTKCSDSADLDQSCSEMPSEL